MWFCSTPLLRLKLKPLKFKIHPVSIREMLLFCHFSSSDFTCLPRFLLFVKLLQFCYFHFFDGVNFDPMSVKIMIKQNKIRINDNFFSVIIHTAKIYSPLIIWQWNYQFVLWVWNAMRKSANGKQKHQKQLRNSFENDGSLWKYWRVSGKNFIDRYLPRIMNRRSKEFQIFEIFHSWLRFSVSRQRKFFVAACKFYDFHAH